MGVSASLEAQVQKRAKGNCEYCRLPSSIYLIPFQIDHIIAEQHGGKTLLENLAYSFFRCNKRKGPNIAGVDRTTNKMVRLFHPRRDRWPEHFQWNGAKLIGLTSIGRATIATLNINHPSALILREELILGGNFPPP